MHPYDRPARASLLVLLAGLAVGIAPAQDWVGVTTNVEMEGLSLAYDSLRDRALTVDAGGRAFEHDGTRWIPVAGLPASPGYRPVVAYQEHSGRTLALVGGSGPLFSTVEYDGHSFTQLTPVHAPPKRQFTHLAYDSGRDVVVLFAGGDLSPLATFQDTWEWNGVDWTQRQPAASPPARQFGAIAYDPVRAVTVLFGGVDGTATTLGDHWEWNGVTWTQRALANLPTARRLSQLAYDATRNRMVLYGGVGPQGGQPHLDPQPWDFDGQQWTQGAIANAPVGRSYHSMVAVPGGVRVFGGARNIFQPTAIEPFEILDYDGVQFTRRAASEATNVYMGHDAARGHTVVLTQELQGSHPPITRLWDGLQLNTTIAGFPTGLAGGLALSDAATSQGVIGFDANGTTWGFNGQWNQLATLGPAARAYPSLAADTARGVVVMFGGFTPSHMFDDTWEWNGTTWTQIPVSGPIGRSNAAMALEPTTGRVVLHGGFVQSIYLYDTWAYTQGAGWGRLSDLRPGEFGRLAWSPARQRLLLARTTAGGFGPSYTFELTGSTWQWLANVAPQDRLAEMATDAHGNIVAVGGGDLIDVSVFTTTPASVTLVGSGCSSRPVAPRVALHDRPRPGSVLRYELVGAEPNGIALFAASHAFATTAIGPCLLHLQQPTVIGIAGTNAVGQAMASIAVPASPALIGVQLGVQIAAGETGGPIAGALALSDAIRIVIGD